jgi:hypothetical protein
MNQNLHFNKSKVVNIKIQETLSEDIKDHMEMLETPRHSAMRLFIQYLTVRGLEKHTYDLEGYRLLFA